MPEFLRGWEMLILLVLLLILFGGKRLPDAARGLGRSLRIFKAETQGLRDDRDADEPRRPEPPREIENRDTTAPTPTPSPERDTRDR